jgi:hypothetical protein
VPACCFGGAGLLLRGAGLLLRDESEIGSHLTAPEPLTVIDLGKAIWPAGARDEGNERGKMLSGWLALGLQAAEPAISC